MKKQNLMIVLLLILSLGLSACQSAQSTESLLPAPATSESKTQETTESAQNPQILLPAFIRDGEKQRWGYIHPTGLFAIEPQFSWTGDFQANGLAVFRQDDLCGLLNQQGQVVTEPVYNDIAPFNEGVAVATCWGSQTTSTLLDSKGQIITQVDGYIFSFAEGLAVLYEADTGLYGYIDKTGQSVLKPAYTSAGNFENGQAFVSFLDGSQAYIDAQGNKKADYIDPFAQGELPMVYAKTFDDGLSIVGKRAEYLDTYSLLNAKGQLILPEGFAGIERLSDQLFAAALPTDTLPMYQYLPKALFDPAGQQLCDYSLYDINPAGPDAFCVSDWQNTWLIDPKGQSYKNFPKLRGNGTLTLTQGLVKAMIDNTLSYYTLKGDLIWTEDPAVTLSGGVLVTREKFSPSRFLLVIYPQISGLLDISVQEQINVDLANAFTDEKQFTQMDGTAASTGELYDSLDFTAEQLNDLLIIHKSGYSYPVGAAHGQPTADYLHINVQNGHTYSLKDLFKKDADYKSRIESMIREQIAKQEASGEMIYDSKNPALNEKQFHLRQESLEIYYGPYEIAAYAAGFPTFDLPYSELKDLINTEGELWLSFN